MRFDPAAIYVASPRIRIPITENDQHPDGSIIVPEVWRSRLDGLEQFG